MRGITLISAILFIAITITAITLVYNSGMPIIKRLGTAASVDQMKEVFQEIDSTVKEVASSGNGSRRRIYLNLDPGKFVVNSTSDQVYWELETDAGVVSPRSHQAYGDVMFGSNLGTSAYRGSYQGTPSYALENEHILAHFRQIGSPSNSQPYSTREILLGIYSKDLGQWMDLGGLEILIDENPSSSQGTGYTGLERESDSLGYGLLRARMESPYLNYTIYFTLETGADFLIIDAEEAA
jgi:hypothetical protein